MKFLRKWANVMSPILAAVMIYASVPMAPAAGGIVTTDQLIDLQADASNRDKITDFLTRQDVKRNKQGCAGEEVYKQIDIAVFICFAARN